MTRLAVVFGAGAVALGDLLVGLRFCPDLLFVLPAGPQSAQYAALLESAGAVLTLTGDADADTGAFRAAAATGVVTFSEVELPVAARLAASAGLPFHSPETVERLTDKHAQRRAMREHGIETPASWLLRGADEWPPDLRLPAVLKPVRGEGSRNTYLVRTEDEGIALAGRLLALEEALVVEECLVGVPSEPFGDYVSVESACAGGRIQTIGVTGKLPLLPPFRENGQFFPDALDDAVRAEVIELTGRTLRALGVRHGITHTEIKITEQGPRVIEVNGRIGGFINELYLRATGLDLIELAGRLALGEDLEVSARPLAGVFFQQYARPPREATRLTAIEGARTLTRTPGITARRQLVQPGTELPGDGKAVYLDLVVGDAPSHREMLAVLDRGLRGIRFTFDTPSGPLTRGGDELRAGVPA
ncbi:carboxylase [Acrocarpospora corrugata]|uniref:Carboxylase n=1 Tax=Acrocarpospora corrugata TaxID=35763 RepID=A0A5M3VXI2_9ACTN|nr:ATP-grasp domain-containing protein [Acrocarpospora corrugata]GES00670.1 carboxylase [Acrocarpospora corrugata]